MRENSYWIPVFLAVALLPVGIITGCTISFFYYQQIMQDQAITKLADSVETLTVKNKVQEEILVAQQAKLIELDDKSSKIISLIEGFDHLLLEQLRILLELNDISELTVNSNVNILNLRKSLVDFCNQFEDFAEYALIFENSLQEEELEGTENKIALLKEAGKIASQLGLRQTTAFIASNLWLDEEGEIPRPEQPVILQQNNHVNTLIQQINSPIVNIFNVNSPSYNLGGSFVAKPIPFDPERSLVGLTEYNSIAEID